MATTLSDLPELGSSPRRASRRLPYRLGPMTPEEENSWLKELGLLGLSALGTVANVLDTPGSVVRGLLAGESSRAVRGVMSPTERVHGRELLESWDILGPNEPGFDWGDVAGVAASVVTDPLFYTTLFGSALTKAGRAVKAAGLLEDAPAIAMAKRAGTLGGPTQVIAAKNLAKRIGPREARLETTVQDALDWLRGMEPLGGRTATATREGAEAAMDDAARAMGVPLSELLDERLGGLLGFGVPFRHPSVTIKGPKAVARAMDVIGREVSESLVGRIAYSIFSSSREIPGGPIPSAAGQAAKRGMFRAQQAGKAEARMLSGRAGLLLEEARNQGEDVYDVIQMRRVFEDISPAATPEARQAAELFARAHDDTLEAYLLQGQRLTPLRDPTIGRYAARFITRRATGKGTGRGAMITSSDPSTLARAAILTDIEGGTAELIGFFQDPAIIAAKKAVNKGRMGLAGLREEVERVGPGHNVLDTYTALTGRELTGRHAKLARFIKEHVSKEQLETGLFGNHPVVDASIRAQTASELVRANASLFDSLALAASKAPLTEETISLSRLFGPKWLNFMKKTSVTLRDGTTEVGGALAQMAGRLGINASEVGGMTVPREFADEMLRLHRGFSTGSAASAVLPFIDDFTNLWKVGVTAWPAFHVRNLISGQFRNWVDGHWSARDAWDAWKLYRGGEIKGAAEYPHVARLLAERGIAPSDRAGTDVLRELLHGYGVSSAKMGEQVASVGVRSTPGAVVTRGLDDSLLREIPGSLGGKKIETAFPKALTGQFEGASWNPMNVRGVGGRAESTWAPAVANEEVGAVVEYMNRAPAFLNQIRHGTAGPGEAARRVALAQVSYERPAFTTTEQTMLKRLFPFYAFLKGNTPYVLRQMVEHPGGRLAQAIRILNSPRKPGVPLPPHIGETAAIPIPPGTPLIGPEEGADPRYLTGTGLMFESALQMLDPYKAGPEILSQLTPLLKAPLEQITGESFFQRGPMGGRDLQDMDPAFGRMLSNIANLAEEKETALAAQPVRISPAIEQLLANSPISRAITSLRTLTDPRKRATTGIEKAGPVAMPGIAAWPNLLTGLRITDVPISAEERMLKEIAGALIRDIPGSRMLERPYLPADVLEALPPEEQEYYGRLQQVRSRVKRR